MRKTQRKGCIYRLKTNGVSNYHDGNGYSLSFCGGHPQLKPKGKWLRDNRSQGTRLEGVSGLREVALLCAGGRGLIIPR